MDYKIWTSIPSGSEDLNYKQISGPAGSSICGSDSALGLLPWVNPLLLVGKRMLLLRWVAEPPLRPTSSAEPLFSCNNSFQKQKWVPRKPTMWVSKENPLSIGWCLNITTKTAAPWEPLPLSCLLSSLPKDTQSGCIATKTVVRMRELPDSVWSPQTTASLLPLLSLREELSPLLKAKA